MASTNILAIDDDECNLEIIQEYLEDENCIVEKISSSTQAWNVLCSNPEQFQIVLLDRMMPEMDGIEFLRRMKSDKKLSHIPVILQTAVITPVQMLEGIKEGAFYYLCKPYMRSVLSKVITSAEEEYWLRVNQNKLKNNSDDNFRRFCLDIGAIDEVTTMGAEISKLFPEPERAIFGINELLINAVEHGNLSIGFDEKEELVLSGSWEAEIKRRQQTPECAKKRVRIHIDESDIEISMTIEDEGIGFEWEKYLFMDENRMTRVNGRGICLSNLSFDSMQYIDPGNKVICKAVKK
jgi:CheY-like chemotaxis protein